MPLLMPRIQTWRKKCRYQVLASGTPASGVSALSSCCDLITMPVTTGPIFMRRRQVPSTVRLDLAPPDLRAPRSFVPCSPPMYISPTTYKRAPPLAFFLTDAELSIRC